MLDITIIKCLSDNYSYLIRDKKTNTVAVVDPSEMDPIDFEIQKSYKKLDFILNTHHHIDHIGGNSGLKKKYRSQIICSLKDKEKIPNADIFKINDDIFSLGKTKFKTIHIPGHTLGHIAFFSQSAKVIFTGDTLFSLGCGKIFEGTFQDMFDSLEKLKKIPKNTMVYCGHEYTKKNAEFCLSVDKENQKLKERVKDVYINIQKKIPTIPVTLETELETNSFLRCDDTKIKDYLKMDKSNKLEVFTELRKLKDNF
tara:strand:+ start:170 stop:934 length:765 start_codon:yes stop_codon:yes gene_type:complete